jgi:hypothetical protein
MMRTERLGSVTCLDRSMRTAGRQPEHSRKRLELRGNRLCVQKPRTHWIYLGTGLLLLAAISVQWAGAQAYVGSIAGVVKDPSGAVIPNATVVATNMRTGFTYNTKTNAHGIYTLTNLPPATYELTFSASGFKKLSRPGIVVAVAQSLAVNVTMEVGATTQSITVAGVSPLLQTQNGATGQTIGSTMLTDMPLVGRNALDLAMLAPGMAVPADTAYGPGSGNNFSSNGGRNMSADVLLDGSNGSVSEQNTSIQEPLYVPPPDTIQEFTVQQNGYSAKYGFSGNTMLNVLVKSGTNQFHGDAYEYNDYEPWNAINWFTDQAGQTPAISRTNYYGFTFGGPIQKNKTFFFVDYEGIPSTSPFTVSEGMPSAAERTGDFSALCTGTGGTFSGAGACSNPNDQLWDPYTSYYNSSIGEPQRTAIIPNNNMASYESPGSPLLIGTPFALPASPGNTINPIAVKAMSYLPLPNLNVGTSAYNPYDNWTGTGVSDSNAYSFDIKVDRQFTANTHVTGRYSEYLALATNSMPAWNNPMDPNIDAGNHTNQYNAMLSLLHNFSPTLLLDATLGYSRQFQHDPGIIGLYPSFNGVQTLGMPAYLETTAGYDLPPSFNIGEGYNTTFGGESSRQYRYALQTQDLVVNLDKMAGHHQLEFGGEGRLFETAFEQAGSPDGYFSWTQTSTSETGLGNIGGDAIADFLTGLPQSDQYGIPLAADTQNFEYAAYIQDEWHVTPNLTLSPGLRYDIYLPSTSRFNQQEWFDPTAVNPLTNDHITLSPAAAADFSSVGLPVPNLSTLYGGLEFASPGNRYQVNPSFTDFSPRFGFAYNYHGTVFRGSYGIFYSQPDYTAHGNAYSTAGFQPYTFGVTTLDNNGYTPWASLTNPFPAANFSPTSDKGLILPTGSSLGLATNLGVGLSTPYVRSWSQVPYIQSWNFGIQHQFGGVLVGAEYVGTKGTHLYFADADGLGSYLGPQVQSYSPAQIQALDSYVPNPFQGLITTPGCGICGPTIQAVNLAVPFPEFPGASAVPPPWANSEYESLQLNVEKRLSHGLDVLANYTWEKALDDASVYGSNVTWIAGVDVTPQDPNNRRLEYSLSEYDTPQILNIAYVYHLPFGHGERFGGSWNRPLDLILGGWQTSGNWRFDSGQPLLFSSNSSEPLPTYGPQRPNFSGPITKNTGNETSRLAQYFANPQVASEPAPYTLGNGPRVSDIFNPGTEDANLAVFKEIPIRKLGEAGRLQLRLDTFNGLNHVQFCAPNTTVGQPAFGLTTCQANSPRLVQIGAKVYW